MLREDPLLVAAFFKAKRLPESTFWQRATYMKGEAAEKVKQEARTQFGNLFSRKQWKNSYDWQALEEQFLSEWEIPELDLHKYWEELTFLFAGYIPGYITSEWTVPELIVDKEYKKDFLPFLVIENSAWDSLPLVNIFGAGTEIDYESDYGPVRYLIQSEVGQILDGLLELSQEGYENRFIRKSQKSETLPGIDWSDEEMLDWMTDYYNEIFDYYHSAVRQHKALLLYLT